MAPKNSIGVNLRVTGHCNQGGRKYMEDVFCVAYQQTEDKKDLEYAFFGIFDGHGGREAALFAKEHLMDFVVFQKGFWSDDDDQVLKAIRDGFISTHLAMWRELDAWPRTVTGLPSTSGTTASIVFIRRKKIYLGHVGDSAIVMGCQADDSPDSWYSTRLTRDHKPGSFNEHLRIQQSGGKVICKSGIPRVVWNRPKLGHKGPVRRSTHIDEIPFLSVARSLGDLWSYNSELDQFIVSPEPDVYVLPIDTNIHKCIILGTDGLWNMIQPHAAVTLAMNIEKANERCLSENIQDQESQKWKNPSKCLVECALIKWGTYDVRADNISVVTVMLDPPGPPNAKMLSRKSQYMHSEGPVHMNPVMKHNSPSQDPSSEVSENSGIETHCVLDKQLIDTTDYNVLSNIAFNDSQTTENSGVNPELNTNLKLTSEPIPKTELKYKRTLRSSSIRTECQSIRTQELCKQKIFSKTSSHDTEITDNQNSDIENSESLHRKMYKQHKKNRKKKVNVNIGPATVSKSIYEYQKCAPSLCTPALYNNSPLEFNQRVLRSRDSEIMRYEAKRSKVRHIKVEKSIRKKKLLTYKYDRTKILRLRTQRLKSGSNKSVK